DDPRGGEEPRGCRGRDRPVPVSRRAGRDSQERRALRGHTCSPRPRSVQAHGPVRRGDCELSPIPAGDGDAARGPGGVTVPAPERRRARPRAPLRAEPPPGGGALLAPPRATPPAL